MMDSNALRIAIRASAGSIAKKAIADAIRRKRFDAWIEENREAIEANAKDIRENGLWSDGLRSF